MKKIMNWLMLSCKKASELIEKKLLIKLSLKENVQLQMHKSMCSACTAYEQQSKKIDEIYHQHFQNIENILPEAKINEGLKTKIVESLQEN